MASKTAVTWTKRENRRRNAGKERKAANRRGTTPKFPIHTPEIDAAAPPAQVSDKA